MISELRRAKRIADYLPIGVTAVNGVTGQTMAGPFSGRIIDISCTGACLLMTQVMIEAYHVFHSTREDDSLFLQLTVNLPPDITNFSISARPVWMNLFRQDEIRAFKMGVEFLTNPEGQQMKQLMQAMAKHRKKRADWWAAHTLGKARTVTISLFS
jgi:c-di-GMP-binding flagellar brake protein YcgR